MDLMDCTLGDPLKLKYPSRGSWAEMRILRLPRGGMGQMCSCSKEKGRQCRPSARTELRNDQLSLPWQCLELLAAAGGRGSLRPAPGALRQLVLGSVSCETEPSSSGLLVVTLDTASARRSSASASFALLALGCGSFIKMRVTSICSTMSTASGKSSRKGSRVFLFGVLLGVAAHVDALAQVIEAPPGARASAGRCSAASPCARRAHARRCQRRSSLLLVRLGGGLQHHLRISSSVGRSLALTLSARPVRWHSSPRGEGRQLPLSFRPGTGRAARRSDDRRSVLAQAGDLRPPLGIEHFVALLVDHLALVVHHTSSYRRRFADVEVALLDLALGPLDGLGRPCFGLDGLALGHLPGPSWPDALAREDAHQRIVQATGRTGWSRVALAAGQPRSWLSMRRLSWRSVPMMRRPPSALHLLVQALPLVLELLDARPSGSSDRLRHPPRQPLDLALDVAAQHDVGAAAGHVGGDGDHAGTAGLGDDLGLLGVLLGVEHLVRMALPAVRA